MASQATLNKRIRTSFTHSTPLVLLGDTPTVSFFLNPWSRRRHFPYHRQRALFDHSPRASWLSQARYCQNPPCWSVL